MTKVSLYDIFYNALVPVRGHIISEHASILVNSVDAATIYESSCSALQVYQHTHPLLCTRQTRTSLNWRAPPSKEKAACVLPWAVSLRWKEVAMDAMSNQERDPGSEQKQTNSPSGKRKAF